MFDKHTIFKKKAIELRKSGYSYGEIITKIKVSKSTLSLWLRKYGLSKEQKQRLLNKKNEAGLKGAKARKNQRIKIVNDILFKAEQEILPISNKELFLIGTMLYWAEGAKQKEHNCSQRVVFSNTDPRMVKVFITWLKTIIKIPDQQIGFDIYLHETAKNQYNKVIEHWSQATGYPLSKFDKIYYKKNKISKYRKNVDENYFGLIRVRVLKSTNLNRKISGWINGIYKNCGVVQW